MEGTPSIGTRMAAIPAPDKKEICAIPAPDKKEICDKLKTMERIYGKKERRGVAIIAIFDEYETSSTLQPLERGKEYKRIVQEAFLPHNFEVRIYEGNKQLEVIPFLDSLAKVSQEDHSDAECFALVIVAHGGKDGLLNAYDGAFNFKDVWKLFTADKCKKLSGKPKMFFVHACRGREESEEAYCSRTGESKMEVKNTLYSIPAESDFLFMYSTFEDKLAYSDRNYLDFIDVLGIVLKADWAKREEEKEQILDLMTNVSNVTATLIYAVSEKNTKQMPTIVSTLRCRYYLK